MRQLQNGAALIPQTEPALLARCDQHDPLPGPQRVLERLVDILQRMFRGNVPQRRAGLDEMPEVVRVKLLMLLQVFVQYQQRFLLVLR